MEAGEAVSGPGRAILRRGRGGRPCTNVEPALRWRLAGQPHAGHAGSPRGKQLYSLSSLERRPPTATASPNPTRGNGDLEHSGESPPNVRLHTHRSIPSGPRVRGGSERPPASLPEGVSCSVCSLHSGRGLTSLGKATRNRRRLKKNRRTDLRHLALGGAESLAQAENPPGPLEPRPGRSPGARGTWGGPWGAAPRAQRPQAAPSAPPTGAARTRPPGRPRPLAARARGQPWGRGCPGPRKLHRKLMSAPGSLREA